MSAKYPWYSIFYRSGHLLALTIMIILVAGFSAIKSLPTLEDPRIDLRNVLVLTAYPGASAERVEALVTDVLEDELRELYEIKRIDSTSKAGFSSLVVELEDWTDAAVNEQVFAKIRDAIASAAQRFPAGAQAPILEDKRGATSYTILHAVQASHDTTDLTIVNRFAQQLADQIRNVSGTELVNLFGQPKEQINILVDPNKLASMGLTGQAVAEAIAGADPKLPAGLIYAEQTNIRIQVADVLNSLDMIRNIPILAHQGQYVRLADVAQISRGTRQPAAEYAYLNGQPVVFVASRMQADQRVGQWTKAVTEQVTAFTSAYHGNIEVYEVFQQNQYTQARLLNLLSSLLIGALVVAGVIFVFMGIRASWIVGLSLPLSIFFTIFTLSFHDVEIHQMSIFGIIIAIGLVIDNAIVLTNDVRANLIELQLSRLDAYITSVKHLFTPLLASTLTTVLGFMPIFLLNGNVGDFIGSISVSVVMALIGSFWISLLIIAALAARFLPDSEHEGCHWYQRGIQTPELALTMREILRRVIEAPKRSLTLIVLFCLSGFFLATTLPNVFFPSADRNQFQVEVFLPKGSSINATQRLTLEIDEYIRQQPAVTQVTWLVGSSAPTVYYNMVMNRDNSPEYASAVLDYVDADSAKAAIDPLQVALQAQFPQAQIVVKAFGQGPPIPAPVEVQIFGPDIDVLRQIGEDVRLIVAEAPGVSQSFASIEMNEPQLRIQTDMDVARNSGLSYTDMSAQLQLALSGLTSTSLVEQTENIPIVLRIADEYRGNLPAIAALPLVSPALTGDNPWLTLNALGHFALEPAITGISRINSERVNRITGFLQQGVPAISVSQQIQTQLANYPLPAGYRIKMGGDADQSAQALGKLATYTPVLLVLMFSTLILTFQSVRLASIVGAVAILSIGLGMLSLWISGLPIGFNPILGCAGLIGVAINDSIVVIAALQDNEKARQGDTQAIIDEVMHCARHVLSTSFTTVGGLVPLLIFTEGSFWPPLAVVLAGGVGFALILALLFTPITYALMARRASRRNVSVSV